MAAKDVTIFDGSSDFSGGVNSLKVTTIQSPRNPNGLKRSELAWLVNGTVRDGGISPRSGWQFKGRIHDGSALYQRGSVYSPVSNSPSIPVNGTPYIMPLIGGNLYKVDPDFFTLPINLTALFPGTGMPASQPMAYFAQGESFLIIQAGDNVTLPLFWDGAVLRRSNGLIPSGTGAVYNLFSPVSWVIPTAGNQVVVPLLGTVANYPGAPGDNVNVSLGALLEGNFSVVAISNTTVGYASFNTTTTSNFVETPMPGPGGSVTFNIAAMYPGNVNDLVYVYLAADYNQGGNQFFGSFKVTNITANTVTLQVQSCPLSGFNLNFGAGLPLWFHGQSNVTLRTTSSNFQGGTLNANTYTYTVISSTTPTAELPAAGPMVYYQGRIWYAQNNQVNAGDIVAGPSGTSAYSFHDSILKVTENPMAIAGDGFNVPSTAGNIRGMSFLATLDTALGQANLLIFTRTAIYSLYVPVTRANWIATSNQNAPLMTVVMRGNGAVNDTSIVAYNGDLYFQSFEPSVRSLIAALRYFQQWANPPLSGNETRLLNFINRNLMQFSSGAVFDNRLLQATLPVQKPQGVVNQAIMPMDFTPLSSLNEQLPPVWEGHYEGLDFLQVLQMDFNGMERSFGIVRNREDGGIDLWEFVSGQKNDSPDNRIDWSIEFPAYTAGDEEMLKKLTGAELWIDKLYGTVDFTLQYRSDGDVCWKNWKSWQECSPRNSCETVENPICYPITPLGESYRSSKTIPAPTDENCESATGRPAYIGYQFQPKLIIKGHCRIRAIRLFMEKLERELYANTTCE